MGMIHDFVLDKGFPQHIEETKQLWPTGFNSDSLIFLRARTYHITERFDEAIELYDEIIKNKTSDFNTRSASNLFKAMIFLEKRNLIRPANSLNIFWKASLNLHGGRWLSIGWKKFRR